MLSSSLLDGSQTSIPSMGIHSLSTIYEFESESAKFNQIMDSILLVKFIKKHDNKLKKFLRKKFAKELSNEIATLNSSKTERNQLPLNTTDLSIDTRDASQLISPDPLKVEVNNNEQKFIFPENPETKQEEQPISPERKNSKELIRLNATISQVLKLLQYSEDFAPVDAILCAEKLVLLSTLKRNLLETPAINPVGYLNDGDCQITGRISFENMRFFDPNAGSKDSYYLCVLRTDRRIFATEIRQADQHGTVKFRKNVMIEHLSADFEVTVMIYKAEVPEHRSIFCKYLDYLDCSHRGQVAPLRKSRFEEVGCKSITTDSIRSIQSQQSQIVPNCRLEVQVWCEVNARTRLDGFLDVGRNTRGNGCVFWSKCWCQLKGDRLLLWRHPSELFYGQPMEALQLWQCVAIEPPSEDQYLRQRTLKLTMRRTEDEQREIYVSAVTEKDFRVWAICLKETVRQLHRWEAIVRDKSSSTNF